MASRGMLNPAAVGQMARATINTLRKAYQGRKSGEPSRGGVKRRKSSPRLGAVKSARGGKAGVRARRVARSAANKLKKGTPAARRHMAKLRAMRKKKR